MDTNTRELSLDVIITQMEHITKQGEEMKKSVEGLRGDMKEGFDKIENKFNKIEDKYATKFEVQSAIQLLRNDLGPTKNIVTGLVGIIVTSVVVALVALVVIK